MNDRSFTHFIAVGACYIDTILTVPAYPLEDAKQRASSITKRRGGNCPNTLEVLQQLYPQQEHKDSSSSSDAALKDQPNQKSRPRLSPRLILLSTMPSPTADDTNFITDSFNIAPTTSTVQTKIHVNLDHVFHRPTVTTAASSYIVQSQATHSRTIVNHNALEEMTASEFQATVTSLLHNSRSQNRKPRDLWFHFEDRIPETTLQCITWLRSEFPLTHGNTTRQQQDNTNLDDDSGVLSLTATATATISVECEKPGREGLDALAELADVVFYSRSWAEGRGYTSAKECLAGEAERINSAARSSVKTEGGGRVVLCCTWGEAGASTLEFDRNIDVTDEEVTKGRIVSRPAWLPETGALEVVDTIGAGDTWIAGMLFGLMSRSMWSGQRRVEFANELAGRKIGRNGFAGLGDEMKMSDV